MFYHYDASIRMFIVSWSEAMKYLVNVSYHILSTFHINVWYVIGKTEHGDKNPTRNEFNLLRLTRGFRLSDAIWTSRVAWFIANVWCASIFLLQTEPKWRGHDEIVEQTSFTKYYHFILTSQNLKITYTYFFD